jgi:hypothetical protein
MSEPVRVIVEPAAYEEAATLVTHDVVPVTAANEVVAEPVPEARQPISPVEKPVEIVARTEPAPHRAPVHKVLEPIVLPPDLVQIETQAERIQENSRVEAGSAVEPRRPRPASKSIPVDEPLVQVETRHE